MTTRTIPTPYQCTTYAGPLGTMTLRATGTAISGIWFDGQKHQPDASHWQRSENCPVLHQAARQLDEYFAGLRHQFDLPLDLSAGTAFQQSVWQQLQHIARGTTVSYGALSHALGKAQAVRAVASAIGRNPVIIVVPCHRVIGAQGNLTGYAAGLDRKRALLTLEQSA